MADEDKEKCCTSAYTIKPDGKVTAIDVRPEIIAKMPPTVVVHEEPKPSGPPEPKSNLPEVLMKFTILGAFVAIASQVPEWDDPRSIYKVKSGDTLCRIAVKYNCPTTALTKANPLITDPNMINVGWDINIPSEHECKTQIVMEPLEKACTKSFLAARQPEVMHASVKTRQ